MQSPSDNSFHTPTSSFDAGRTMPLDSGMQHKGNRKTIPPTCDLSTPANNTTITAALHASPEKREQMRRNYIPTQESLWRRILNFLGLHRTFPRTPVYRKLSIAELTNQHSSSETNPDLSGPSNSARLLNLSQQYEIKDTVAVGGYGGIERALDRRLNREVAIKSLRAEFSGSHAARSAFQGEARLMAYLDHPSIVPIYDYYTDEGDNLHLSMKLIHGINMKELLEKCVDAYAIIPFSECKESERILLNERLEVLLKVCDAVAYAHNKQVIHRDLKPENIMISDFNAVYVMDWGIAEHQTVNNLSRYSGRIAGTLRYIAPEILKRRPYDSRSDIYSLGMILYEIAFLHSAYNGTTDGAIRAQILEHNLRPFVHEFGVSVPRDLKLIIDKALMPHPEERYQNVNVFAEDIRRFMRLQPIRAEDNPMRGFISRLRRRVFGS